MDVRVSSDSYLHGSLLAEATVANVAGIAACLIGLAICCWFIAGWFR